MAEDSRAKLAQQQAASDSDNASAAQVRELNARLTEQVLQLTDARAALEASKQALELDLARLRQQLGLSSRLLATAVASPACPCMPLRSCLCPLRCSAAGMVYPMAARRVRLTAWGGATEQAQSEKVAAARDRDQLRSKAKSDLALVHPSPSPSPRALVCSCACACSRAHHCRRLGNAERAADGCRLARG